MKRSASEVVGADAEAKTDASEPGPKRLNRESNKDGSTLSEETKSTLMGAIVEVLVQFQDLGEPVVRGSAVYTVLAGEPRVAGLVNEAKEAFGGKGWMRKMATIYGDTFGVEFIDVKDREPHYRLASSEPFDISSLKAVADLGEVALPVEVHDDARKLLDRAVEVLVEAAARGESFMPGSLIRNGFGEGLAGAVQAVSRAFGSGRQQKGWIKKLFSIEPCIEHVTTEKGEPCFQLAPGADVTQRSQPTFLVGDISKDGQTLRGDGRLGRGKVGAKGRGKGKHGAKGRNADATGMNPQQMQMMFNMMGSNGMDPQQMQMMFHMMGMMNGGGGMGNMNMMGGNMMGGNMRGGDNGDPSGCSVFVHGFDFGTTDEQLEAHMSSVGTLENVRWITKGSAQVKYSSVDEAAAAVEQLAKTTIEGNSREIDVSLAKADGQHSARRFDSGGDPSGCTVFVHGFDVGTTDEQLEAHMSSVGTLENVRWITKGSAQVKYSSVDEAAAAVEQLAKTTIEGNSGEIDVSLARADGQHSAKRFNSGGAVQGGGGKGQRKGPIGNVSLPAQFATEGEAVLQAAKEILARLQEEVGYVEGSKLNKILAEEQPEASAAVRGAFNGKGWLKKLLSTDPSIELVTPAGRDEPCFRRVG